MEGLALGLLLDGREGTRMKADKDRRASQGSRKWKGLLSDGFYFLCTVESEII